MIRIPGAQLVPLRFNPYSGSSACALVLQQPATMQDLSRHTGGSGEQRFSREFTSLAKNVEDAFESSRLRNKNHRTASGDPITLEPYQKLGIAFGLIRRGRAGLFDPMGLGKTVQALALSVICPDLYLPLVVVAPRNALGAWQKQLGGLGNDPAALSKAWVRPGALDVRVIKTHDELFQAALDIQRRPEGSNDFAYVIWNQRLAADGADDPLQAQQREWALEVIAGRLAQRGLLVFDEGHYYRVPTSEMFANAYNMSRHAAHVLVLTGTPSLSSVTETLPLLALVERQSTIIPELSQFQQVVSQDDAAAQASWRNLQEGFIRRHIARSGSRGTSRAVPENRPLSDFAPYTRQDAASVESEFRRMAVRRSRRSVAELTRDPPLKVGIGQKTRTLSLVQPTAAQLQVLNSNQANEDLFRERAALMARVDGLILDAVMRGTLNANSTADDIRSAPDRSGLPTIDFNLRQFGCATAILRQAVQRDSTEAMAKAVLGEAVNRFGSGLPRDAQGNPTAYRPTVYFADNIAVAEDLARELFRVYEHEALGANGLEVYLLTSRTEGQVVRNSTGDVVFRKPRGQQRDQTFIDYVATRFEPQDFDKPRIFISTRLGREGVDLPAGIDVVFVQRFQAPGLEEQAEDRINRANRSPSAPTPNVIYYMPEHYLSFALINRLERRRASALRTYGETVGDDFSAPLTFPYDVATGNVVNDFIRRAAGAEQDAASDYASYLKNRLAWAVATAPTPAAHRIVQDLALSLNGPYALMGLTPSQRTEWCRERERRQRRAAAAAPQQPATPRPPSVPTGVRRGAGPAQQQQPAVAPAPQPRPGAIRRSGSSGAAAVNMFPSTFRGQSGTWSGVADASELSVGTAFIGNHVGDGWIRGVIARPPGTAPARGAVFYTRLDESGNAMAGVQRLSAPRDFVDLRAWRPARRNPPWWML